MAGWIKLHRSIQNHWIWENEKYLKWWLDLILLANHQENKILINGELETIEIGERHTSQDKLAIRWETSRSTVKKFLDLLVKDGMITVRKSRQKGTTYKVNNYSVYQGFSEEKKHQNEQRSIQQTEHQTIQQTNNELYNGLSINKNDKELKNDKNITSSTSSGDLNEYKLNAHDAYQQIFSVESSLIFQSIENWISDFDGNEDIVVYALSETEKAQASNFKYTERIMKNWLSKGIKTVEQAKTAQAAFDKRKQFEIEKKESANEQLYGSPDKPKPTTQVPLHNWVKQ